MHYTVKDYFTKNDWYCFPYSDIVLENAFQQRIAKEELENLTLSTAGIPITVQRVSLLADGFSVSVSYHGTVALRYGTDRSLRYAMRALDELAERTPEGCRLRVADIYDAPAFRIRGVIEGFYGHPYSLEERMDLIGCLSRWRMNSYFYAPKDDTYHREKWRTPYPQGKLKELSQLTAACAAQNIDFWYCISPGKDFTFTNESDFAALEAKARQISSLGVTQFALLMDDIDYQLKDCDEAYFHGPGRAHAHLVNRFQASFPDCAVAMCPTEYFQLTDSTYRTSLREEMDPNIAVFWTGYNTVAEVISRADGEAARRIFGHDLILWDNYPVNDFQPKKRIYLGPLVNRSSSLAESHIGMVANPMISWAVSKLAVRTMADYMWAPERYDPERSLTCAVKELFPERLVESVLAFVRLNASSAMRYEDGWLEELYARSNYSALADYYQKTAERVKELYALPEPYLSAFRPYIDYFLSETALFWEVAESNVRAESVAALTDAPVRTAQQLILKHIKERGLVPDAEHIQVDGERERYWKL